MKNKSYTEPIEPLRHIVEKFGWQRLNGYDRCYYATPDGNICSVHKPTGKLKELKGTASKDGYITVKLKQAGRHTTKRLNRLIAQAFIPNPDNKPIAHHKNHDRQDNRRVNLAWVTARENRNK